MDHSKLTAAEQNILSPYTARPHPDGKPWDKCCGTKGRESCMCLTRKPAKGLSRLDMILTGIFSGWAGGSQTVKEAAEKAIAEGARFMCCHRLTEDGYNRECAGWAAKFKKGKSDEALPDNQGPADA